MNENPFTTEDRIKVSRNVHDLLHKGSNPHTGEFGEEFFIVPKEDYRIMKGCLNAMIGEECPLPVNEWQAQCMSLVAERYLKG